MDGNNGYPIDGFERFLEERCFEDNPQILDDERSDFFNNYISELSPEAFITQAEAWMLQLKSEILELLKK